MKKDAKKRIIALMLAAMMCASAFSACTTEGAESSNEGSTESQTESSETTDSSEAIEGDESEAEGDTEDAGYTKMDGDVELAPLGEFPIVIGEPVTLSVFTTPHLDNNTEFSSDVNAFTAWFEEKLNVKFDWTIASKADKEAKQNIMFNSDDYQDIIFDTEWDGATQYAYGEQGYLIPLNDYMENESYYYDIFIEAGYEEGSIDDAQMSSLVMPDGNIYSAPKFSQAFHSLYASRMYIYQPWLDAVGMDMPTTTDEYYEVLKAFATQDPNGNGEADEIPLAGAVVQGWNTDPIEFIMNSFQYHQIDDASRTFIEDGQVVLNYMTDEFKAGLEYMAMLAEEGLYLKETYTQDNNALKSLATQEVQLVGSVPAGSWGVFSVASSGNEGDWLNYVPMAPLEGPEGVQYAKYYAPNPLAQAHITDACEYPLTAWRVIDAMYDKEVSLNALNGLQSEGYWDYAEEGQVGLDGSPATHYTTFTESDADNSATNFAWSQISPAQTFPGYHTGQAVKGDPEMDLEGKLYKAGELYAPYQPEDGVVMPKLIFNIDDSKLVIDYQTSINDYVDSAIATFVRDGGVEEGWDAYIATLESMGANELQSLYQKAYEERLAVIG